VITYTFNVEGKPYQGSLLAFGAKREWFNGKKGSIKAQKIADQYPAGSPVEVHYNPSKPQDAVLKVRAASGVSTMIAAVALILVGLGIGIAEFIQLLK
jgi:Protein of unknown function (DUF3592)